MKYAALMLGTSVSTIASAQPAPADVQPPPSVVAATNAATGPGMAVMQVAVKITGGYQTDPRDKGRPVALVAAALGVPADVFRKAFSHVHPAPAGQEPQPEDVRKNKKALMEALSSYGVTNDRLDEVSNYYRYRRDQSELWRHQDATAVAVIEDGEVRRITVTHAGAGYNSVPDVTIPGMPNVHLKASVLFGTDLSKNGSIGQIEVEPLKR